MTKEKSEDPSRRDYLKSVGAAGVVTIPGFDINTKTRIIEVGYIYNIPNKKKYKHIHVDEFPEYVIDEKSKKVSVHPLANQDTIATLKNEIAVSQKSLKTPPVTIGQETGVSGIPVGLNKYNRVVEAVPLGKKHKLPKVRITSPNSNGKVNIILENISRQIREGEKVKFELPQMPINPTYLVDRKNSNGKKIVSEEVMATPHVVVNDRGKLDVVQR